MLALLGTIITGVMSGGATGLFGVLLQRYFDMKKQQNDLELVKVNNANALQVRQLELEAQAKMADRAADAQERVAALDTQARESEAAARDYQASMQADRATYLAPEAQQSSRTARILMAIVDFMRGIIRPGVTIYVLGLETMLVLWVRDMYQRAAFTLTPAQTHDLALQIIGVVVYLATAIPVWWFGIRPSRQK
jgi:hypothetical protein